MRPPSSSWISCWIAAAVRPPSFGGQSGVSSTHLCPTRNQLGRAFPSHHQTNKELISLSIHKEAR